MKTTFTTMAINRFIPYCIIAAAAAWPGSRVPAAAHPQFGKATSAIFGYQMSFPFLMPSGETITKGTAHDFGSFPGYLRETGDIELHRPVR